MDLTQQKADLLIAMAKYKVNDEISRFPLPGRSVSVKLTSFDRKQEFLLDVFRGRIALNKITYQTRAQAIIPLVRVDIGGAPHRNPDGMEISVPHIHLYREGYGDKWAFPLPADKFPSPGDQYKTLYDFYRYCNIIEPPLLENVLF